MITEVEAAVVAYVTDKLNADSTLDAVTWTIQPATTKDALDRTATEIIVAGRPQQKTMVSLSEIICEIYVTTSASSTDQSVAHHSLVEQAVERAFDRTVHASADSELNTEIGNRLAGWTGANFHPQGWQDGREETHFAPFFGVKVGVVKE